MQCLIKILSLFVQFNPKRFIPKQTNKTDLDAMLVPKVLNDVTISDLQLPEQNTVHDQQLRFKDTFLSFASHFT